MAEFLRDVLNVFIVLGTPVLIFWLILRPAKTRNRTEHVVSDAKGFFREYHLWGLLVIGFALSVWSVGHKQSEAVPGSSVDPFSGVLEIDAAGCQIIGPDGKSLKDSIREQSQAKGKALIPEGSTLNGDCFPSAKAARSTQSSSQ